MDTKQFIDQLFGLKDDRTWILTWEKDLDPKQGRSKWFQSHLEAAAYIAGKQNIYICAGMSWQNRGKYKRMTVDQVHGIPGFFIDIDVQHKHAHKKKNLPATIEEARSLIESYGWDPTIIMHSGHGLQAWWLFKEPLMFDDQDEWAETLGLSRRLQATIKERANEKGWEIDNTSNLDRLMRPIGTVNQKENCDPVMATVLQYNEKVRYNPDDFDEILLEIEPSISSNLISNSEPITQSNPEVVSEPSSASNPLGKSEPRGASNPITDSESCSESKPKNTSANKVVNITQEIKEKSKTLELNENAEPSFEKFAAINQIFAPEFINTWNNDRDDELNDTSPSGYDFTLALMAAQCNWTDQEIMDLMIAFRRKHGHDLHLSNIQKYIRTIINARSKIETEEAQKAVDVAADLTGSDYQNIDQNRKAVCKRLGFQDIRILCFPEDPPVFRLIVNNKKTEFRSSNKLMEFRQFREQVGNLIKKRIVCSKKEWDDKLADLIMSIVEDVPVDEMRTAIGIVKIWLKKYLKSRPKYPVEEGAPDNQPFIHKGNWYMFPIQFDAYTRQTCNNRDPREILFRILEFDLGLSKKSISYRKKTDKKVTSVKCWKVPIAIIDPSRTLNTAPQAESEGADVVHLDDKRNADRHD